MNKLDKLIVAVSDKWNSMSPANKKTVLIVAGALAAFVAISIVL